MVGLLIWSAAVLIGVLGVAFLLGSLFRSTKTRKRIMSAAFAVWLVAFSCYFGFVAFILSGKLN
jgi:hypothetical protein